MMVRFYRNFETRRCVTNVSKIVFGPTAADFAVWAQLEIFLKLFRTIGFSAAGGSDDTNLALKWSGNGTGIDRNGPHTSG